PDSLDDRERGGLAAHAPLRRKAHRGDRRGRGRRRVLRSGSAADPSAGRARGSRVGRVLLRDLPEARGGGGAAAGPLTPHRLAAILSGPLFSSVAQWQSIRLLTGGL